MSWMELPFDGERLESVVHFGSGKDAELKLVFANGQPRVIPVNEVRFQIDGGVIIEVSPWDDVSLRSEYRAPGLTFHSGRVGIPEENDDEIMAVFRDEVQSWLATGHAEELGWVVEAQISLSVRH